MPEYARLGWPVLRLVAWCYIGGTVAVNVSAACGQWQGPRCTAAMPVLFIAMEGVRHLVRQWAGLTGGTRPENTIANGELPALIELGRSANANDPIRRRVEAKRSFPAPTRNEEADVPAAS